MPIFQHNIDSFGRDRKTKTEKISRKRKITKAVKNDETETGSENSDDTIEHSSDLMLPESLIGKCQMEKKLAICNISCVLDSKLFHF